MHVLVWFSCHCRKVEPVNLTSLSLVLQIHEGVWLEEISVKLVIDDWLNTERFRVGLIETCLAITFC